MHGWSVHIGDECRNNSWKRFRLIRSAKFLAVLTTAAILLSAVTSHAQSARLHIVLVKAGIIKPAHGNGSLFYKSRRFRLDVAGIDFDALGAARADLEGDVLNLRTVGNIIGTYQAADKGLAVVSAGNVVRLRNASGVTLELRGVKFQRDLSINLAGITVASRGWRAPQ
jgi:hypothetical protein